MTNTSRSRWREPAPCVFALLPCVLAFGLVLPRLGLNRLWYHELWVANAIVGGLYEPRALNTVPVGLATLVGTVVRLTAPTETWLRAEVACLEVASQTGSRLQPTTVVPEL